MVPMPRMARLAPLSSSADWTRLLSNPGSPSVINRICPPCAPAVSSNSAASSTALVASAPGRGMMAGESAGMRLATVRVSSVSGVTTWASPANTTRPVTPSCRVSSRSSIFCRARCTRLGWTSAANIEALRSRTITSASARLITGSSTRCRLGPAAPSVTSASRRVGIQMRERCALPR